MKRYSFTGLLSGAAMLFFLISCGGGGGDDKTSPEDTSGAATATVPAEVNTIVTTPVSMVMVTHKVANFEKWKAAYESHDSIRLANGIHSYVIGRGVADSNMVMVVVKVDDMAKAKDFAKSPDLKKAMQKSGVSGTPSFSFNTTVWQDTAALAPGTLRSRTTFTVKDWDAWQKAFLEGKPERTDNGIADRVFGHDADDNKKVFLVTALLDTAKARAYWSSDMLKKRREAGGVIGEPDRFVFRIVQRY